MWRQKIRSKIATVVGMTSRNSMPCGLSPNSFRGRQRWSHEHLPAATHPADPKALDRYFWKQREAMHSRALETETDPERRVWHEDKLSNARAKLTGVNA
jgi:hypothetical protein